MKRAAIRLCVVFVLGLGLAAALLWVTGSVGGDISRSVVRAAERPRPAQAAGDVYCVTAEGGAYPGCTQVFTNVQAAVDAASGGETIKIATGTYTDVHARPRMDTLTTGVVTQVVYISKTVHIEGGYTTTNWDTSYPITQPTTLDAGRQGRVIYITGAPSASSGQAVSLTLAGLRITGGDAGGLGGCLGDVGGGVYVISASATIRDSQISGSYGMHGGGVGLCYSRLTFQESTVIANGPAYGGGGMLTYHSTATLNSSAIISNHATAFGGGAWFIYSDVTFSDSEVMSNTSDDDGGGLQLQDCTGTFVDSTISSNSAEWIGGGLMLWGGDYTVIESVIVSNTACEGGGLVAGGTITLAGNTIARNSARSDGGGVYLAGADAVLTLNTITSNTALYGYGGGIDIGDSAVSFEGNVVMYNSASEGGGIALRPGYVLGAQGSEGTFGSNVIAHNMASDVGGGLYVDSSPVTLTNALIHDNYAASKGGGVYIHSFHGEPAHFVHSTIARNTGGDGSGIHVTDAYGAYGNVWLTNTILVSHTVGITVAAGSTATLEATLWGTDTWGNGMDWGGVGTILTGTPAYNWWAAPSFVDPDGGDYHLRSDSAAVDKGVDAGVATDIDGDGRPMGAGPDLGADETAGALYVDRDATGLGNGLSWTDAYIDLQSALDAAVPGDQVWVANGVYTPTQRTDAGDARTATFVLTDGVALYGGFAGGETALDQRDWEANVTVLSGDIDGNDTTDAYGVITDTGNISGSNAYHVVVGDGVTTTAVLDGFWITGGYADGSTFETGTGGGMRADDGSPTLENLVFSGNFGSVGGGLYAQYSSSALKGIVFAGNAASSGGGMSSWGGSPTVTDAAFRGNVSSGAGGAVESNQTDLTMRDVLFEGNTADGSGGGVYSLNSVLTLTNATFYGNVSGDDGGGIHNLQGALSLTNGVFGGNAAASEGGGLSTWSARTVLANVTFAGNDAGNCGGAVGSAYMEGPDGLELTNCILWGNTASMGTYAQVCGPATLQYTLMEGGCPGGITCDRLLDADPLFVREPDPGLDGVWGTPDDDYGDLRLRPGSPAIDAGSNLSVPVSVTTDLAGNPRFLDVTGQPDTGLGTPPIVDMGAYEAAFVDLAVSKALTPSVVAPGDAITYTLVFSNAGSLVARGVMITDLMPVTVTVTHVVSSGVQITDVGAASDYAWEVADLAPGEGGAITITGVVSPSVHGVFSLTNQVFITTTDEDWDANDNVAVVSSTVDGRRWVYLPLVAREE